MDFSNYISPLSWRYGTPEMRKIFSEENKYRLWRRIWVLLAEAQHKAGLVSGKELADLKKHEKDLDISRIIKIEKDSRHDVVAAIREFTEKAKTGGGKIHFGATSQDIVDNTDAIRIKEALTLVRSNIVELLKLFVPLIEKYADFPCMGFTHIQPAEPTTVGYRLAFYAQNLLIDLELLTFLQQTLKSKGMKGAVGTRASYVSILKDTKMTAEELDDYVMKSLELIPSLITTQVYPRKYDYLVLTLVASIASSCAKFAGDLRILQSPPVGEWSEPFGKKQVGSSAMPFKKNPVTSEKICSLARYITQLPPVALENASLSYLERTLDDSANMRLIISEGFIALEEILLMMKKVVTGLVINEKRISYNLAVYGPFAATESIIITCVKKGANRQAIHELLREISMKAWQDIQAGKKNPIPELLSNNRELRRYLNQKELTSLLDVTHHIGDAPVRANRLLQQLRKTATK